MSHRLAHGNATSPAYAEVGLRDAAHCATVRHYNPQPQRTPFCFYQGTCLLPHVHIINTIAWEVRWAVGA